VKAFVALAPVLHLGHMQGFTRILAEVAPGINVS